MNENASRIAHIADTKVCRDCAAVRPGKEPPMKSRKCLSAALGIALLAGCAHKDSSTAQTPPPNLSEFEKTKDPPIQAQTHFAAGMLAESQGDYGQAIGQYRKALKLDPKNVEALYHLGIVCTATKDFPSAIDAWNKYIALTRSASAYSNLAFCQELAGNPAAAEAAYRQGIQRDAASEPCHVNYGLMLVRHGRPNEGLLQLQTVLPPAKAHYDLAAVYEQLGHKKEAKSEYAKALELDPQFQDAKTKLASLED
jgi:Flp pilus assembly protein TadD